MGKVVEPSCVTCKHYWKYDGENGACRRYPPIPFAKLTETQSSFPHVKPEWTCGEFKLRGA